MAFELTSEAVKQGQAIPRKYTGDGDDVPPPLAWSSVPPGTRELAVVMEDPDAPGSTPFVHWLVYKIPPGLGGLTERITTGGRAAIREGKNSFGNIGYGGPAPPPGKPHHYHFRLFALDQPLEVLPGADKSSLRRAMEGHVLAEADLVGTYGRGPS